MAPEERWKRESREERGGIIKSLFSPNYLWQTGAQGPYTTSPQEWFPSPRTRRQAIKAQAGCVKSCSVKGELENEASKSQGRGLWPTEGSTVVEWLPLVVGVAVPSESCPEGHKSWFTYHQVQLDVLLSNQLPFISSIIKLAAIY